MVPGSMLSADTTPDYLKLSQNPAAGGTAGIANNLVRALLNGDRQFKMNGGRPGANPTSPGPVEGPVTMGAAPALAAPPPMVRGGPPPAWPPSSAGVPYTGAAMGVASPGIAGMLSQPPMVGPNAY